MSAERRREAMRHTRRYYTARCAEARDRFAARSQRRRWRSCDGIEASYMPASGAMKKSGIRAAGMTEEEDDQERNIQDEWRARLYSVAAPRASRHVGVIRHSPARCQRTTAMRAGEAAVIPRALCRKMHTCWHARTRCYGMRKITLILRAYDVENAMSFVYAGDYTHYRGENVVTRQ